MKDYLCLECQARRSASDDIWSECERCQRVFQMKQRKLAKSSAHLAFRHQAAMVLLRNKASGLNVDPDTEVLWEAFTERVMWSQHRTRVMELCPVEATQMLNTFLHTQFPASEVKADLRTRASYLFGLPDMDFTTTPLLKNAVAMLCYSHLDARNEHVARQANEAFGRTLAALNQLLQKKRKLQNADHRNILTAMHLLAISHDAVGGDETNTWQSHYLGIEAYLKTHGPNSLDLDNPYDRILYINVRLPVLYIALARRRSTILNATEWEAYDAKMNKTVSHLRFTCSVAFSLAQLLEQVEFSCAFGMSDSNSRHLWVTLARLKQCIADILRNDPDIGRHVQRLEESSMDVSETASFDPEIEEHRVIMSSRTFPSVFRIGKNIIPFLFAKYSFHQLLMFGIIVDCTLLRLLHFYPRIAEDPQIPKRTKKSPASIERSAHDYANRISRLFYFLSTFPQQGYIDFLYMLIELVQNFYAETGVQPAVEWCQAVGQANRARYARIASNEPRTMCRLRDLHTDLTSLTTFRAPPLFDSSSPGSYTATVMDQTREDSPPPMCPFAMPS